MKTLNKNEKKLKTDNPNLSFELDHIVLEKMEKNGISVSKNIENYKNSYLSLQINIKLNLKRSKFKILETRK